MKLILPFIPVLLIASCGGNNESSETTSANDTTSVDTIAADSNIVINQDSLNAVFGKATELPYIQDTSLLFEITGDDSTWLTKDQVKYLTYGFVDSDISYSGLYHVDDFYFFDSLSNIEGAYEEYLSVLDIGMMAQANVFAVQRLKLDDSTSIMLWCVNYSTYEACPYASGTIMYGTIIRNDHVTSCTILGEDSSGADAPVWGETLVLCSLKKDQMTAWRRDKNCDGEQDEEGNDIVDESENEFILSIGQKGNWEITAQKTE
ncbi:MAG: hypothetical protein IPM77_03715 [Crocinitomicaceae bacterium]|jgi:hypothetical protein|nr:hypothetical protein [Crocinitomicaceae bacterium]